MAITYRIFPPVTEQIKAHFWSKVAIDVPDKCWLWQGGTIPQRGNYGRFYINRKDFRAHRCAYYFTYNTDPGQFDVMHSCDNPICVNPHHLSVGTRKDNHDDMTRKGRRCYYRREHPEKALKGEDHYATTLTNEQVLEIRRRHIFRKVTMKQLAAEYGVSWSTVQGIISRKSWKHI